MKQPKQDFLQILNANSFIINGETKSGKITFAFYLSMFLFQKKTLIFTPQEKYLFKRRINALKNLYSQFQNIEENISTFYLKSQDWKTLKQRYGFDFFLQEIEKIIANSSEEVVLIHRFGEFFEFQDRYEIENVYKKLIAICDNYNKKLIVIVNNSNENFSLIYQIADEFSDVSISIELNELNQRQIRIRDLLHNREYPLLNFIIQENSFLLDYHKKEELDRSECIKNVLICELNDTHDNIFDILNYIFDKPGFRVKRATSLQTILKEIFVSPEIIIVLMKREDQNFEITRSIKEHLPSSYIIGILEQSFVRAEDAQKAFAYGIDELFAHNLSLDSLILACQKASKDLFYTRELERLPQMPNILKSKEDIRTLAKAALDASIFFTLFVFKVKEDFKLSAPSRKYDHLYQENDKLYYIAMNTAPKDVDKIIERYGLDGLICLWEPINHTDIESCL